MTIKRFLNLSNFLNMKLLDVFYLSKKQSYYLFNFIFAKIELN